MKEFKEIETQKVATVSEYVSRPDGGGTAFVTFKDSRGKKGTGTHVSLTKDEYTQIKGS